MPPRAPRIRLLALAIVLECVLKSSLPGQVLFTDTTISLPQRQLVLGFERNVNTYAWDLRGGSEFQGNGWNVRLDNVFRSSIIRTDRNLIRDENSFGLSGNASLSSRLKAVVKAHSFIFSDQRSIALNSLAGHSLLAGIDWSPFMAIRITPLAGYKFDNQLGVQDQGFMYAGNLILNPYRFDRYEVSGLAFLSAEYLDPRFLEDQKIQGQLSVSFTPSADNRILVEYRKLHREYYLPYDENIHRLYGVEHPVETRGEQQFSLGDRLYYRIAESLTTTLGLNLSQRLIEKRQRYRNPESAFPIFDEDIREFRLHVNGSLDYAGDRGTRAGVRMLFDERDERYQLRPDETMDPIAIARQEKKIEQKNNAIQQTQISLQFQTPVTLRDTLVISGATVKTRYDTPSDANDDDRDELFLHVRALWSHRFSDRLTAQLAGEANMRHTVYIFGERSANNLWNRVIRIAPSTEYRNPGHFRSRLDAEVVANYSVYDFEDVTQSVRSFSLRQMTITDSLSIALTTRIWITGMLQLRLYERGELYWKAFRLRPLDLFEEKTLLLALEYSRSRLRIAPGIRMFQQYRYGYTNLEKRRDYELLSIGPTCFLEYTFPTGSRVFLDGWYQVNRETGSTERMVPNLTMNVLWNL